MRIDPVTQMRDPIGTWREILSEAMSEYGERIEDIVSITLSEEELDIKFRAGYSAFAEGLPFTAWTENRVYFPVDHDGAEGVKSVPRNPNGVPTEHI
jgi:hypothetical protein